MWALYQRSILSHQVEQASLIGWRWRAPAADVVGPVELILSGRNELRPAFAIGRQLQPDGPSVGSRGVAGVVPGPLAPPAPRTGRTGAATDPGMNHGIASCPRSRSGAGRWPSRCAHWRSSGASLAVENGEFEMPQFTFGTTKNGSRKSATA